MRTYELIEIKSESGNYQTLKATEGEREIWIPTDSRNKDYAEYLRYTAWVEAGNKPEDFWKQNESEI